MPELPEVEVSRQGISPYLENQQLVKVIARQRQLRWWVPDEVMAQTNQPVLSVTRRAKYLLIQLPKGDIILHLGMSGHLKVIPADTPATKHDHIDLVLASGMALRLSCFVVTRAFKRWFKFENQMVIILNISEQLDDDDRTDYADIYSRIKFFLFQGEYYILRAVKLWLD